MIKVIYILEMKQIGIEQKAGFNENGDPPMADKGGQGKHDNKNNRMIIGKHQRQTMDWKFYKKQQKVNVGTKLIMIEKCQVLSKQRAGVFIGV